MKIKFFLLLLILSSGCALVISEYPPPPVPVKPVILGADKTNSTTPGWTWNKVENCDKYRYKLNDGEWVETGKTFFVSENNLSDGIWNFFVEAGNQSGWSKTARYITEVRSTAPGVPGAIALEAGYDTGYSSADRITTSGSVIITGGSDSSTDTYRIDIYNNFTLVKSGDFTILDTAWSISGVPLQNGTNLIAVKQIDSFGNSSAYSSLLVVTRDTSSPQITVIDYPPNGSTDLPINTEFQFLFNETMNPSVTGSVTIGNYTMNNTNATITINDKTVTVTPLNTNLLSANYFFNQITISGFIDIAGNTMTSYSNTNYSICTGDSEKINISLNTASDLGYSQTDNITKSGNIIIDGVNNIYSKLYFFVDGSIVHTVTDATTDPSVWQIPLTFFNDLTDDNYFVFVKQENGSGIQSGSSNILQITIDKTKPGVTTITPTGDLSGDEVSVDSNITIIFNENINPLVIGTVSLDSDGSPIVYENGINCTISVSSKQITVNPTTDFDYKETYSNITIEGFQDIAGNEMNLYNDTDYEFITEKNSGS